MKKNTFVLLMLLAILLGSFLRLFQIGNQILGSDEWHAINTAGNKTLSYILTHFQASDNSIPMTVFYKFLLSTFGLNELSIRSLQLFSGIICLFIFPFLIQKILSKEIAIYYAFLHAISPFFIFYSRFSRPYIIVLLLSFISIACFYLWLKEEKLSYILIYLFAAILAPYFLLISFPTVLFPIFFAFLILLFQKHNIRFFEKHEKIRLKSLYIVALCLTIGYAAWIFPALKTSGQILKKTAKGSIKPETLKGFVILLTGTPNILLILLFILCALYGMYFLSRKNKLVFYYFFPLLFIQILPIIILRPLSIEFSEVFARYMISIFPVFLLMVSVGLNRLNTAFINFLPIKERPKLFFLIPSVFIFSLFIKGPLPSIYRLPNNFMNHPDYQGDYQKKDLNILCSKIPDFYLELSKTKTVNSIIEMPYLMNWKGISYHLYQKIHKKRILIGYSNYFSLVKTPFKRHEKIRLHNFVSIQKPEEISSSQASYLIIHKDVLRELIYVEGEFSGYNRDEKLLERLKDNYSQLAVKSAEDITKIMDKKFGVPYYQDKWITVFRIN